MTSYVPSEPLLIENIVFGAMPTLDVGMFSRNSHAHASVSMEPNDFFNGLLVGDARLK
jgi:hypothetical protein